MKVIVTESYEASCREAANIIAAVIKEKSDAKIGLATGSTPLPVYKNLIHMNKNGEVDFSAVRTVNLDEYIGLAPHHPQSYRRFMNENFFNHINIDKNNTYVASGMGNPEENAKELDGKVYENGVTDLQLLGIGNNGHIAFNEARDYLVADSHVEELTESTINANSRFFEDKKDVPTKAVSMGMGGILAADKIVLVATGEGKAEAVKGLLSDGKITTWNPSTFLKLHKDATIIIDEELAKLAGYKK